MKIFEALSSAMYADDVDAYMALHHPDFRYDRQKSGDSIGFDEMAEVLRKVWAPGNREIEDLKCIYENDDLLLVRLRLSFRSGSRESALIAYLKKDGKIIRTESGVSELAKAS